MTVDQIIALAYSDTWTTSNQIASSVLIDWVNIAYHDLVETIKNEVDPDFFYDYWTTDIVANQNEYVLQVWDNNDVGIDKVTQVGVKYATTDTQFQLLSYKDSSSFDYMPEWYETNQPTSSWFYTAKDRSIFIYPTPTVNVTNWLRLHGIYTPIDLVEWGAEATIKFARQYHEGIALWARRRVYARRAMPDMEIDSINKFNEFKQGMVKSLRRQIAQPLNRQIPSLIPTFN